MYKKNNILPAASKGSGIISVGKGWRPLPLPDSIPQSSSSLFPSLGGVTSSLGGVKGNIRRD